MAAPLAGQWTVATVVRECFPLLLDYVDRSSAHRSLFASETSAALLPWRKLRMGGGNSDAVDEREKHCTRRINDDVASSHNYHVTALVMPAARQSKGAGSNRTALNAQLDAST